MSEKKICFYYTFICLAVECTVSADSTNASGEKTLCADPALARHVILYDTGLRSQLNDPGVAASYEDRSAGPRYENTISSPL